MKLLEVRMISSILKFIISFAKNRSVGSEVETRALHADIVIVS